MKSELKLPFYLAYQSIKRGRKWTFFLTIFLMAVAFINLIFVSALFNGIVQGSNQQIVDTLTGNVYMVPKQGADTIDDKQSLVDSIKQIDGVKNISTSLQIPARIEKDSRSGRWPLLAINPDDYKNVFNTPDKMYSGSYLDPNDENGILIGRQIAGGESLELNSTSLKNVKVGDKVNVIFDGLEKAFVVRGIFYTKFIESDSKAFITNKALNNLVPNSANNASIINIKTEPAKEKSVLSEILGQNLNTDTYLWTESAGLMKSVSSSFLSINALMTTVGAIIAGVTTFIVIYVDVINRRRQIGILRAIGIKPYIIISSYVILASVYAFVGVLLGSLIFFFGLVPYFDAHPFSLPITDAVLNLHWADYLGRIEIVLWVAVFSGLIPALIVTRTKMLDAILGR